jgi:hypothetical protein
MSTVFDSLSDEFYAAFFEPDAEKRKNSIDLWIKTAVPILKSAVEDEIRNYLELILKDTWTDEGWKNRAKKFAGVYFESSKKKQLFIDTYKLCLQIKVKQPDKRVQNTIISPVTSEIRTSTLNALRTIKSLINPGEKKKENIQNTKNTNNSNQEDDDYTDDDNGRSPNDDRSDSMNPNNDSYQSAVDNHSNQMNPNNDAYWSSRGR